MLTITKLRINVRSLNLKFLDSGQSFWTELSEFACTCDLTIVTVGHCTLQDDHVEKSTTTSQKIGQELAGQMTRQTLSNMDVLNGRAQFKSLQ